jgi:Carboxypeptidase regulatory-like domain
MFTKRVLPVAVVCSIALFICPLLHGQANGSFFGTVSDKTGSVVTGTRVTVTSEATGLAREAKTDDTGHYLIPLLPVGNFKIRVESQGFKPVEQSDVRLQVNEQRELDFTLVPGAVTEQVEVSATEVAVQTSNPSLGQVITSQQVADLPLNGRDFVQLATLTPGTVQETNPNSFFNGGPSSEVSTRGSYSLSVGGSRAQSTDWLFDGNDNNELTAGGISILPSIDAIQEFKVLTYNYSAEYGTRAGPTVLVTTKSGSNQFHGSLFEFFRNTSLDARSFFASSREKFNLNQFGGALGGPIRKEKTFFFIDYQGRRQRKGIPFVGLIPTPAMKNGDYSLDPFGSPRSGFLINPYTPKTATDRAFQCDGSGTPTALNSDGTQVPGIDCNRIPQALWNPAGKAMIDFYPISNASNAALGINFTNVPVRKLNEGEFDVRVDHNFSSKDTVFARFSYDQATNFVPGGSPGFAEPSAFASTQDITNHGRNVAISETHIFSSNSVNQISGGFNRIFNHILSFGDRSCTAARIGIAGANLDASCPGAPPGLSQSTTDCVSCGLTSTMMFGGYWSLGDRGFAPFQGGTNVFTISDSFDMIRGRHNIRIGGQVRAHQMNVLTNAFQDGFLLMFGANTGDATADLLLGQIGGGLHDQTFKGATTGRRWKLFRPYVQDDWRITNSLTINLGLAYALVTPITEAQNRQANFNFDLRCSTPPGCNYLIPGVNSDGRVGIELDKTALEPRIGFAWRPFGQNTAIRGGYAIFHDSSWNQGAQGLWENPPFFAETANFSGLCPYAGTAPNGMANASSTPGCGLSQAFTPILTSVNPATFAGTIQSQNLDFKQGRVQQFNLNIEHQLPGNVVVTAGYAGSRSHHILVDGLNLNVASPSACDPTSLNFDPNYHLGCGILAAPFGPFTTIANINDKGDARYDSLQLKAETKSVRHGLYALLGYTYARNFDSGFPDGLGSSPGATYFPLPGTRRADWALSQIQLNHSFTASVLYDLPFGKGKRFGSDWNGAVNAVLGNWELDVIEKITSGFPVFVINSNNQSGSSFMFNGSGLNRPDQVCDPNLSNPSVSAWFNTSCFVPAGQGKLGDSNRTPLYGPDFVNTDFSAIKHFPLPGREGMMLDFRAEFFNIFNHAQFFVPNSDLNSVSGFGAINQTVNNPRLIQFALKLRF